MESAKPEHQNQRPSVKSWCGHIKILSPAICWEEIRRRQENQECDTCRVPGPNLWLCLARGCTHVGCGEAVKDHSTTHGKDCHHHLTINLTTLRIWCFACSTEVFPGHNNPPLNIPEVAPANMVAASGRSEGSNSSTPQRSLSGAEDSESDMDDENTRPRGLTGLQNLGNTCYLNSAVQALSNCPPLTRFFLDCQGYVRPEKSPMLSKSYMKLISELWHKKRPSYVVPSGIVSGIKVVHPMFRGYNQQDAQEFLRCFMDQLHEDLKYPVAPSDDEEEDEPDSTESGIATPTDSDMHSLAASAIGGGDARKILGRQNSIDSSSSQSECEYETCDSGLSSERGSQADHNMSSDESGDPGEHTSCLPATTSSSAPVTGFAGRAADSSTSTSRQSPSSQRRQNKNRNSISSASSSPPRYRQDDTIDKVANLKEIKETANLLSKIETENARQQGCTGLQKSESGEYLDALSDSTPAANTRSKTASTGPCQQQRPASPLQMQSPQQQQRSDIAAGKSLASTISPHIGVKVSGRRKVVQYESVISHIFDGKILSSVQCLYCERVSTTKETFQDLSLPIPSKDYLQVLHSGHPAATQGGGTISGPRGGACGDQLGNQGWLTWMFSWMKSWFVGPTITLQDCLSAFFSADELKGDNMYSCEQCKKLRNGLKYSKVLKLPEILCIHLKRFRHEFFSSKISTYISFPLNGLEMKPYLHKDCKAEVTSYDLVAVVCHHGTAGGGHYTAYCLNHINEQWYEFDDQYVTEVDVSQVINCEAYVLFYKKNDEHMLNLRMKAMAIRDAREPSLMQFYVSKQWINRFNTFAEPGPITNSDFLCKHGGVPPNKVGHVEMLVEPLEQAVWELLYSKFGGGPVCNRLYPCQVCQQELETLKNRQKAEMDAFIELNEQFQAEETQQPVIYAMSMAWFREWEAFVRGKTDTPPGPIDNTRISMVRNGQTQLRPSSDHGQLSRDMWHFLFNIYGGGPELIIRQRTVSSSQLANSSAASSSSPTLKELAAGSSQSSATSPQSQASTVKNLPPPTPTATSTTQPAPATVDSAASASLQADNSLSPHNSSSSSSSSTITPSLSPSKTNSTATNRRPSAVSDCGDSSEENSPSGSRSGTVGSGSVSGSPPGVSTMQEVKGIPLPMDVTRL